MWHQSEGTCHGQTARGAGSSGSSRIPRPWLSSSQPHGRPETTRLPGGRTTLPRPPVKGLTWDTVSFSKTNHGLEKILAKSTGCTKGLQNTPKNRIRV